MTGISPAVLLFGVDGFRKAQRNNNDGEMPVIGISGRQVLVNGKPLHMKGICWNPVAKGDKHPDNLDFAGFAEQDATLMQQAGINVVRTYEPLLDKNVLDIFYRKGIYVVNSAYSWGGSSVDDAVRW